MKLNFTFKGLRTINILFIPIKIPYTRLIREYNLKDAKASFKKLYNFKWKTINIK